MKRSAWSIAASGNAAAVSTIQDRQVQLQIPRLRVARNSSWSAPFLWPAARRGLYSVSSLKTI
ncbi:hypothetical protein CGL41_05640 [Cutibacterium acnes]|uniref:Uncharacterized protein n=1 Tax=Cutibacterium acnes TaxID=1747 RepID=A0AA44QJ53_CUTAC|nr:hypothetical protein HMPREF9602_00829 [Cutibacterium acnes HL030PA2]OQY11936.1 MAG: hypothetical protein B6I33_07520 [Propionibacterium sp. 4572_24]PGF26768.1 hypothetical protein B1B06_05480 [Cutibacterium acnes subsp. acnes]PGF34951.1 hypothetical protein B1B09_04855 [Cutibacterium acnes]PGF42423.1 hypothetical protein B1B15_04390 [Cutibacterium acnes]